MQSNEAMFYASSRQEGAVTIQAQNFCGNGSVSTAGTVVCQGQAHLNGSMTEHAEGGRKILFQKLEQAYFSCEDVQTYEDDFETGQMNYEMKTPVTVLGNASIQGNAFLRSALKAMQDITIQSETCNAQSAVLYSKYGDITINGTYISLNGLIYAPFGEVRIRANNLNLNQIVIIAEKITLEGLCINANYSQETGAFVDIPSEEFTIPEEDEDYLKDSDEDGLWDAMEREIGSDPYNVDTDGDGLPDGYEVNATGTSPVNVDTDSNGILDVDEDPDEDSLTNLEEYKLGTLPSCSDSDDDELSDGDEINQYKTDPLLADTDSDGLEDGEEITLGTSPLLSDTDGDGILDPDETSPQTYWYEVEEEDCAVRQINLQTSATGNLDASTEIESVMEEDVMSSHVAGLVGEPFEITTESDFEEAVLSFQVDKDRLNGTKFTDLVFLWYDEENQDFNMLHTTYDEEQNTVSTTVNGCGEYMLVDKTQWLAAWNQPLDYSGGKEKRETCYTVLAVDCSGSMDWNDPRNIIPPVSGAYDPVYDCGRYQACCSYFQTMDAGDKAAVVTFDTKAEVVCGLTGDQTLITKACAAFYEDDKTSFDAALKKSMGVLTSSTGGTRLLSQKHSKYNTKRTKVVKKNKTGNLNYASYMKYLHDMNDHYFSVLPGAGVLGTSMASKINQYSSHYKLGLHAKWCRSKKKMLPRIKKMLKKDVPVTMSIGPCKSKKGINFYGWSSKKNDKYNFSTVLEDDVRGHYFIYTDSTYTMVQKQRTRKNGTSLSKPV